MMTPFSGLSLFIHLAIIGGAKLLDIIRGERQLFLGSAKSRARGPRWYSAVISIAIIIFVSTIMLSFAGIAIQTGVREGAREAHIQYLHKTVASFMDSDTYYYTRASTPATTLSASDMELAESRHAIEIQSAAHLYKN